MKLTTLRLPVPWGELGFDDPADLGGTVVTEGPVAWGWHPAVPDLGIPDAGPLDGHHVDSWWVDHVVVLTPNLDETAAVLAAVGLAPRLTMEVNGRPTAFYRVGAVLEVITSPARGPALFGVALATDEPLEVVALRWRSAGFDVGDPRDAIQPDRRIMTVRGLDAGLAVMTP